MSREARAAQFLPFAALTGYEAMVRETTRTTEPRRELGEEGAARLAERLAGVVRGDRVAVTRYAHGGYETLEGRVRQVDADLRVLRLEGACVPFDDLWDVEVLP